MLFRSRYGVILPSNHPAQKNYKNFTKYFGENGGTLVIAISSKGLYQEKKFRVWQKLGEQINRIAGVESVLSEPRLVYLENDKVNKKFVPHSVLYNAEKNSEQSVSEVKKTIKNNPFFNGFIYNDSTQVTLMLVEINKEFLEDKGKSKVVKIGRAHV